jgi:very-short-patch-repair endonuclease
MEMVFIEPQTIAISSHKKYIFNCHVCKHSYEQAPADKTYGQGCPFCSNKQLCYDRCILCLSKSCDIYEDIWSDKNEISPKTVFIKSGKKFWFDCHICNHSYEQTPCDKSQGSGCLYCSNSKLCGFLDCLFCLQKSCYVYKDTWSVKNITKNGIYIKPETVSISNGKKFWFQCKKCNHDYLQRPNDKTKKNQGCPRCVNKTETLVADYLEETGINFIIQYKIGSSRKRYDFYLPDHKLIVEVDGEQHFRQVGNWESYEKTLENDIEKMKTSLLNGISVLRIYQPDIWYDKIDWKSCINDNLYTRPTPTVAFSSFNLEIYNNHKVSIVM